MIIYSLFGGLLRLILSGGNVLSSNNEALSEITNTINELDILSKLSNAIPLTLILIIVTFIAYSLLSGILASMTTNMEDFQQLQTPLMIILMLGYYIGIMASAFKGSIFIKTISYIPFLSSMVAPITYILGETSLIDLGISAIVLAISCVVLFKYGIRVYKVGILNYSSTKLWKKMFKSLKNKE